MITFSCFGHARSEIRKREKFAFVKNLFQNVFINNKVFCMDGKYTDDSSPSSGDKIFIKDSEAHLSSFQKLYSRRIIFLTFGFGKFNQKFDKEQH